MANSANSSMAYLVLKELAATNTPLGANFLSLRVDVSQSTIGRILQELEFKGYVTKSSNKGRMLTDLGRKHFDDLQVDQHSQHYASELLNMLNSKEQQNLLDVLETRILLEQHTVKEAALKATPAQIKELEDILDRQNHLHAIDQLGENENLEFHTKIAEIAGNQVITTFLNLIMQQNEAYIHFSLLKFRFSARYNDEHLNILNAIKTKNPELAQKLIKDHFKALIEDAQKLTKVE